MWTTHAYWVAKPSLILLRPCTSCNTVSRDVLVLNLNPCIVNLFFYPLGDINDGSSWYMCPIYVCQAAKLLLLSLELCMLCNTASRDFLVLNLYPQICAAAVQFLNFGSHPNQTQSSGPNLLRFQNNVWVVFRACIYMFNVWAKTSLSLLSFCCHEQVQHKDLHAYISGCSIPISHQEAVRGCWASNHVNTDHQEPRLQLSDNHI